MTTLTPSQTRDAVYWMEHLGMALEQMPPEPDFGDGLRLMLPDVIPLKSDFSGDDHTYGWLVANDFNGYDLTTTDPTKKETTE